MSEAKRRQARDILRPDIVVFGHELMASFTAIELDENPAPGDRLLPNPPQTRNSQPRTLASAGAKAGHSILSKSD